MRSMCSYTLPATCGMHHRALLPAPCQQRPSLRCHAQASLHLKTDSVDQSGLSSLAKFGRVPILPRATGTNVIMGTLHLSTPLQRRWAARSSSSDANNHSDQDNDQVYHHML